MSMLMFTLKNSIEKVMGFYIKISLKIYWFRLVSWSASTPRPTQVYRAGFLATILLDYASQIVHTYHRARFKQLSAVQEMDLNHVLVLAEEYL